MHIALVCMRSVIMTYHNTLAAVRTGLNGVGGVYNNLASLQGRVPAMFGIELSDPRLAPASVSLFVNGTTVVEGLLNNITASYSTYAGFHGVAVHTSYAYNALSKAETPGATGLINVCNSYWGLINAMANDTIWSSMKVYRMPANSLVRTMDVGGYIPGPFIVAVDPTNVGPYRVELYDGPNGTKQTSRSPVVSMTCGRMA